MQVLNVEQLDGYKVTELKVFLKERGLATSGRKKDLINRLREHIAVASTDQQQEAEEKESGTGEKVSEEVGETSEEVAGKENEVVEEGKPSDETEAPGEEKEQMEESAEDEEAKQADAVGKKRKRVEAEAETEDDKSSATREQQVTPKDINKDRKTEDVDVDAFMDDEEVYDESFTTQSLNVPENASAVTVAKKENNKKRKTEATSTLEEASETPEPKQEATDTLLIRNFTRPCRETDVSALLTKHGGTVVEMWMNAIKSLCYVQFEKADQAVSCHDYVVGRKWSPDSKLPLDAKFVDAAEMKNAVERESTLRKEAEEKRQEEQEKREQLQKQKEERRAAAAAVTEEKRQDRVADFEKIPDLDLDNLFRKTQAQPSLYWKPLTEEEVANRVRHPRSPNFDRRRRDRPRGGFHRDGWRR